MPGSVFSTKRAIAISAPVLPADTQASATPSFDQIDRDPQRRVLFLAQRVGGRLVHVDRLAGRMDRQALARRRLHARQRGGQRRFQPDEDDARIRRRLEERDRRRHGDRWAVVAAHRIDGYGYGHGG